MSDTINKIMDFLNDNKAENIYQLLESPYDDFLGDN
jgi:hypothetical protein